MAICATCGKLAPVQDTIPCLLPLPTRPRREWEQTRGKEVFPLRKYELVCIVQPELDETAFNGVVEKVKGWIGEAGGNVDKVDVWGKRRLATPIRKHRDGQYVLMNISMPSKSTAEVERNLRFLEPVMRHMLSVVE